MRLILRLRAPGWPSWPAVASQAGDDYPDPPLVAADPGMAVGAGSPWTVLSDRHSAFECASCQGRMLWKRRRTVLERLRWSVIYACADCGHEMRLPIWELHWSSLTVPRCSRCGNRRLSRFECEDPIERLSASPVSMICKLLGAPILYCFRCRTQFYDFRAPEPSASCIRKETLDRAGLRTG